MANELARTDLSGEVQQACVAIEKVAGECSLVALSTMGRFERTFVLARGIQQMRTIITKEMMDNIMALQGTQLGFRTDKDRQGGYPVETVRECLIEATLRGWYPVNNEFNIITGRTYGTKNGLARNLAEFPGLTDLKRSLGVPKMMTGGCIVPHSATWKLHGKEDKIQGEIPVRLNEGQGADAALGKAHRKQSAAILDRLTGSVQTIDGEVDDLPTVKTGNAAGANELADQLEGKVLGEPSGGGADGTATDSGVVVDNKAALMTELRRKWSAKSDAEQAAAGKTPKADGTKATELSQWVQAKFHKPLATLPDDKLKEAVEALG